MLLGFIENGDGVYPVGVPPEVLKVPPLGVVFDPRNKLSSGGFVEATGAGEATGVLLYPAAYCGLNEVPPVVVTFGAVHHGN